MIYYFKKRKNATETHKTDLCYVREGVVTGLTFQKWFVSFLILLTFWPNNYSL